jgi:hypothetical protein
MIYGVRLTDGDQQEFSGASINFGFARLAASSSHCWSPERRRQASAIRSNESISQTAAFLERHAERVLFGTGNVASNSMCRRTTAIITTVLGALICRAGFSSSLSEEVIYHVNSYRVPCVGVAPMRCLQVQRGDPATREWQYFYSQIRGFDFQPGYRYRLLVRETRLPPEQVPADASSIRYELVEVLEMTADPRLSTEDT